MKNNGLEYKLKLASKNTRKKITGFQKELSESNFPKLVVKREKAAAKRALAEEKADLRAQINTEKNRTFKAKYGGLMSKAKTAGKGIVRFAKAQQKPTGVKSSKFRMTAVEKLVDNPFAGKSSNELMMDQKKNSRQMPFL